MKKVGVIQSNYIPWKGYFDIIHDSDLFIFYDDVQYTKNDWRNRNKVKSADGARWLTIPIHKHEHRLICDVRLGAPDWGRTHWDTIGQLYRKAPYFRLYKGFFEHVYLERRWELLSELNQFLIESISRDMLGIRTEFADSRTFGASGGRLARLLDLLSMVGANAYVSGPSAKSYIDETEFERKGIQLVYKDYSKYPEYPQFYPPFAHGVTILDLLFQTGPEAPYFIWGWRERSPIAPELGRYSPDS